MAASSPSSVDGHWSLMDLVAAENSRLDEWRPFLISKGFGKSEVGVQTVVLGGTTD